MQKIFIQFLENYFQRSNDMLCYINKIELLEDLKYIPIYVYDNMSPYKILEIYEMSLKEYEKIGLEDKLMKKLKVIYLPNNKKPLWFFISNDRKLVNMEKFVDPRKAENLMKWFNNEMTRYILKIIPIEEIKFFPLLITKDKKYDDLSSWIEYCKKLYKKELEDSGIPMNNIKIRVVTSKQSEHKYNRYKRFFYADNKIIYIDVSGCFSYEEEIKRLNEVKNWWMLQKLQSL